MEKEHNYIISTIRRDQESYRESKCLELGGHFWEEQILDDPRVCEPWRRSVFRICDVCKKREFVRPSNWEIEEERNDLSS